MAIFSVECRDSVNVSHSWGEFEHKCRLTGFQIFAGGAQLADNQFYTKYANNCYF